MKGQTKDWYTITDIDRLDSPALVVFPARIAYNIHAAIAMTGDADRLRPHVKTHKSTEVTHLLLDAGITRFKCATIAEGEMLGMCRAPDVLLAYQPAGPKINRLSNLVINYPGTRYSCLIDNLFSAQTISDAFAEKGLCLNVYIDYNPGLNRTGAPSAEHAWQLYLAASEMEGIRPIGIHVHDGHLRDPDLNSRISACDASFAPVLTIEQRITAAHLPQPVIIAGGSTTFVIHSKREKVECSPGTFVYWDKMLEETCSELPFKPAALLISRVISLPAPGKICIDLGYKSVAAENELEKRVYWLNAPELLPLIQCEEHLVLWAPHDHDYHVGDVLYGLPYHICPTVALYETVYAVEEHRLSGAWSNIARDRKLNY